MAAGNEKLTINLGPVDLGRIDLLVQEGFYANRSDFIRTAIRSQLVAEREPLARSIERHSLDMGVRDITRDELEAARREGRALNISVVGLARIASEICSKVVYAGV
ncbi:hypothetical protein SAHY_18525 [Salinisphaera hydrothermalis EPR70]